MMSSSRRSDRTSNLVDVEGLYTETLVAEILSGKVEIKDLGIAELPYNQRCQLLQKDLPLRSVKSQIVQKAAISEFQQLQIETSKQNRMHKGVEAVRRKKPTTTERGTTLKMEANLEREMEPMLMDLHDKVAEIKICAEPFQQEKAHDAQMDARARKKKRLEKSNRLLGNMVTRILCNAPKGTLPVSEVKKYERLVQEGYQQ